MVLFVTVHVITRYVFAKPTIWAWDVNIQLAGLLVILGGGFTLLHRSHIGVDILVVRLSPRKRAILDLITGLLFFMGVGVLLWKTVDASWASFMRREVYTSYLAPPIYPLKLIMIGGVALLLLQGISKFIRDFDTAFFGKSGERS